MVKTYRVLLDKAYLFRLRKLLRQMISEGTVALKREGAGTISTRILVDSRYLRQFNEVSVPLVDSELDSENLWEIIGSRFSKIHQELYGWQIQDGKVETLNLRVTISGEIPHPIYDKMTKSRDDCSSAFRDHRNVLLKGSEAKLDCYYGSKLKFGQEIRGPAIIDHEMTTILVEDQYNGLVDPYGSLLLFKDALKEKAHALVNGII
jgi:N-methylhydantoinase A/oxoprolinase/acetone carboxylase beta subunit